MNGTSGDHPALNRRLLLTGGLLALAGCNETPVSVPSDVALPPLSGLTNASGAPLPGVATASFSNRTTLLSFWGTWCPYCRSEWDALQQLSADRRFRLVGVAVRDSAETVRAYVTQNGNPYSALSADPEGQFARIFRQRGVPAKFLIGPDLSIAEHVVGPVSQEPVMRKITLAVQRLSTARS